MREHLAMTILMQLGEQYSDIVQQYNINIQPRLDPNTIEHFKINKRITNSEVFDTLNDIVDAYRIHSKYLKGISKND